MSKDHVINNNETAENGNEVAKYNLEKAICWYNKAAENGYEIAQYNLGRCYVLGIGVEKDEIKAFEYYKKSAEKGHNMAQNILGNLFFDGQGTEKDLAKLLNIIKNLLKKDIIWLKILLVIYMKVVKVQKKI